MKAVKRVIALVLAVVLCIAFAACGTTTNNTSSSATGSQESKKATSDAAEAKPTNGKLVMATNASFPPYEYYENETYRIKIAVQTSPVVRIVFFDVYTDAEEGGNG